MVEHPPVTPEGVHGSRWRLTCLWGSKADHKRLPGKGVLVSRAIIRELILSRDCSCVGPERTTIISIHKDPQEDGPVLLTCTRTRTAPGRTRTGPASDWPPPRTCARRHTWGQTDGQEDVSALDSLETCHLLRSSISRGSARSFRSLTSWRRATSQRAMIWTQRGTPGVPGHREGHQVSHSWCNRTAASAALLLLQGYKTTAPLWRTALTDLLFTSFFFFLSLFFTVGEVKIQVCVQVCVQVRVQVCVQVCVRLTSPSRDDLSYLGQGVHHAARLGFGLPKVVEVEGTDPEV